MRSFRKRHFCKKRADDLLKMNRNQLKLVVAILTGHTSVRGPPAYYRPV